MLGKLTYPIYENSSGWNLMLEKRIYKNPWEKLENQYDYIIIGAGFTGLACAARLADLEPDKSILIIEALQVGEGSSGRNSGFLLPGHGGAKSSDIKIKQRRVYQEGLKWLKDRVKEHNISCGWSELPKIDAAATPIGIQNLKNKEKEYRELGVPYKKLDQASIFKKTGTNYYSEGLEVEGNTFIQPAQLIRGLADNLPSNVTLLELTAVEKLEVGVLNKVVVRGKTITSPVVVLANNGFAKKLGFLKDRLVTIYTYAGVTPELNVDDSNHGDDAWGIIPAHRLGTTLRKIKGNRFMVRSEYSYEKPMSQFAADVLLKDCYRRRYPNLKTHNFEFVWGGVTALTHNTQPYFGRYPNTNIFISAGCNGAGGVKGTTHGKYLAEMIVGKESEELTILQQIEKPSYLPPEPFRALGANIAIRYQRKKAGLER